MVYGIGTIVLSVFSLLKAATVAISSKWIQMAPTMAMEEINAYALLIVTLAALVMCLYYLLSIPVKQFAPEKVISPFHLVFTRAVWSILNLFQVY